MITMIFNIYIAQINIHQMHRIILKLIIIIINIYIAQINLQALVVQTSDSAIHRINHYPADSVIDFRNTYPLDSDLPGGYRYPTFEQPGPGGYDQMHLGQDHSQF